MVRLALQVMLGPPGIGEFFVVLLLVFKAAVPLVNLAFYTRFTVYKSAPKCLSFFALCVTWLANKYAYVYRDSQKDRPLRLRSDGEGAGEAGGEGRLVQ